MGSQHLLEVLHLRSENAAALISAALATLVALWLARAVTSFLRVRAGLSTIPSAPGSLPIFGHVIPLLKCTLRHIGAWELMEEWIKASPEGIVRFQILGTHGVAVSDPSALKRIFQTRYKAYNKDLDLSYHPFLPILGTGLVTADGDLWQKQRLLIGPALRAEILDDIIPIAKSATDRLSAKLEAIRGTGQTIDMNEEFRLLTLQVIGEAVLSLGYDECDRVFPQLYLPVMEEANQRVLRPYRKYLPIPAWFTFRSRMAQLNAYLVDLFRQRWAARQQGQPRAGRSDILDRVLDSIQESGTRWDSALETQLCYEFKTFLLAGHETSAAMLSWSVWELSQSQAATSKVREEANRAFGPKEADPPRREVDEMVYTLSVLKEALRKYSVVPVVTRKLMVEDELMGHRVPPGTMIACILQHTHRGYKDPLKFDPERYMPGGEYDQFDESIRLFKFCPFIQGPRNCLGQHLALLEARVVLSLLCKRFTFTPVVPGEPLRDPDIVPVGPKGGLTVTVS